MSIQQDKVTRVFDAAVEGYYRVGQYREAVEILKPNLDTQKKTRARGL